MEMLSSAFQDAIKKVVALSKTSTVVTEQNVYQIGQREIVPLIDKMIEALILPGSGIGGMEHLSDLFNRAQGGKSCLLLLEHYSNMDLPIFSYLLRNMCFVGINGELLHVRPGDMMDDYVSEDVVRVTASPVVS